MPIKLPAGYESWDTVNIAISDFMERENPYLHSVPDYISDQAPRLLLDSVANRLLETEGRLGPQGIYGPFERYVAILDRGHMPGREKLERLGPMMQAPAKERCSAIVQVLRELELKELGV